MTSKVLRTLGFVLLASLLVVSCAQPQPTPTPKPQPTTAAPTAAPTEVPTEAKPFRAVMLTDLGGLSGSEKNKGFTDLGWDGFLKAKEELGVEITVVEAREQADYEPNITKVAQAGYDIIIGVGFLLTDAMNKIAPQFPDTKFAIIDSVVDQPNVASYVFKEEEGSFLVGAVAGGMTKTGIIGFVGGMEVPLIKKFEVGYIAGAKTVNPDVKVLSAYTGNFSDPGSGKQVSLSMHSKGADIIYAAAGACGLGTIEAAQQNDFYAIGVDTDQDGVAPGYVLCSMLKHVETATFTAIKEAKEGNFKPGIHVLGLKENGVGISPMTYTKDKVPAELLEKVEKLKEMIIAGEIVVPTTEDELNAFEPPSL